MSAIRPPVPLGDAWRGRTHYRILMVIAATLAMGLAGAGSAMAALPSTAAETAIATAVVYGGTLTTVGQCPRVEVGLRYPTYAYTGALTGFTAGITYSVWVFRPTGDPWWAYRSSKVATATGQLVFHNDLFSPTAAGFALAMDHVAVASTVGHSGDVHSGPLPGLLVEPTVRIGVNPNCNGSTAAGGEIVASFGYNGMDYSGAGGLYTANYPSGYLLLYDSSGSQISLVSKTRILWRVFITNSPSSTSRMAMQRDGNLVVYLRVDGRDKAVWQSPTYGHPGSLVRLQLDGNLVVYAPTNKALWQSHTYGL